MSKGIELDIGWYAVENDGLRDFRWCAGLSDLRLPAMPFPLIALFAGTDRPGREMRVYADEVHTATLATVRGWNYYLVPLPPCTRLTLLVEPFTPDVGDNRTLGLMVSSIFLIDDTVDCATVVRALPESKVARIVEPVLSSVAVGSGDTLRSHRKAPGFKDQNRYDSGVFDLGYSNQTVFLNPSIFSADGLCLVARRCDRMPRHSKADHNVFDNTIRFFRLDDCLAVSEEIDVRIPVGEAGEQHEDPRAMWHEGTLYVGCCAYISPAQRFLHQKLLIFDENLGYRDSIDPVYGGNGDHVLTNRRTEKNWTWFMHEGALHCVYQMLPHTVVRFDATGHPVTVHQTFGPVQSSWQYGECRMGSNPVLVDGLYYGFFHSFLPSARWIRQYYMGIYTFEATPPFRIVEVSPNPLLVGSEEDVNEFGSPLVVFPCGAVLLDDVWLVTFGVNDERCGWLRIPHRAVRKRLAPLRGGATRIVRAADDHG